MLVANALDQVNSISGKKFPEKDFMLWINAEHSLLKRSERYVFL